MPARPIAWERSEVHRWLLVCNCLPAAWYIAPIRPCIYPHWTGRGVFEKLELFLTPFVLKSTHRAKTVGFAFTHDLVNALPRSSRYATSSILNTTPR